MQKTVSLTVNGKPVSATVEGRTLLVQLLREQLGLTGTHVGCDTNQCGACVVHVDGEAVKACTLLAARPKAVRCSRSRPSRTVTPCTRCRKRSATITLCNAGFVRPA